MFEFLKKLLVTTPSPLRKIAQPESAYRVHIRGGAVTLRKPDSSLQSLALEDLVGVIIETNDLGPFAPDVYWVLLSEKDENLFFPMGASGEERVIEKLQSLPGFDNDAMIRAMSSTQVQRFICWRRHDHSEDETDKSSING
ncbi:MAG: hypothetical protein ACE37H_07740 [Phycisphaeraceae bacterium]